MKKIYGLLGRTLGHSFSPEIHRLLGNGDYRLFPMEEEQLKEFLEVTVKREGKIAGLNVTIPYKEKVMAYCDRISPEARRIGCVNTLVREEDGSLSGYNTDAYGLATMAKAAGISFRDKDVLILGTGGTSLTAAYVAMEGRARSVAKVSRRGPLTYENLKDSREGRRAQILINTTPVGMYPENGTCLVDLRDFPNLEGVLDVVYNPSCTALLFQARELGLPGSTGLPMLVAQGKKSGEYFLGQEIPDEKILEIIGLLKGDLLNIVLIGMPGSGKTTLGKLLAQRTGREFLDTDDLVEERAQRKISDIFQREGEEAFRQMESEVCAEVGKKSGIILATGGGAVLRKENRQRLKQNGRVFLLERPMEDLPLGGYRPLSKDFRALEDMKRKRWPLYLEMADVLVEPGSPEEMAERILKEMERLI